jgi:hypothetical protein
MKVKGLLNKDSIYYYCVACGDWFEIDENEDKVCEHYEGWGIEKVEDDEFETFRCVVKLNYEVKIKSKTEGV